MAEASSPLVNGSAVLELRKRRGWTQAHLSSVSGVNQSVISRIENEQPPYNCDLVHVVRLAVAYHVPVSQILHDPHFETVPSMPEIDDGLLAVVQVLSKYPIDQQRQACLVLEGFVNALMYMDGTFFDFDTER